MKSNLKEKILLELFKNHFTVKSLKGCFDIIARKDSQIILIKVLEDANSISTDSINEMKKISAAIKASPVIISEKAGQKLQDNVIYSRYGIYTVNINTFLDTINNKPVFIRSKKSGLSVELLGKNLKELREKEDLSLGILSKKIGVSARMILKYEKEDSEISANKAAKIYELFGTQAFKKIDVFDFSFEERFQNKSEISSKYHELGFDPFETRKVPFDIIAKKDREIILTKVGDKINKDLERISSLIGSDNLVIFKNKKPKDIPALKKGEFFEFEDASELIKFLKEFS